MPESLKKLLSPGVAFLHDLLMIPVAWIGAHWLRFNLEGIPQPFLDRALLSLLLIVPVLYLVYARVAMPETREPEIALAIEALPAAADRDEKVEMFAR